MGRSMVDHEFLKTEPNENSTSIKEVLEGYTLYVNGEENGYYKMSYYKGDNEYSGYFPKKYIKIVRGEGKPLYRATFASEVNVYEKASENSDISSKRVEDALFYIDNTVGDWCEVSYSDNGNWYYGYVQKEYLIPNDVKPPFEYEYAYRMGMSMVDHAFLKTEPNENSTSIKEVLKGYTLYVNGEENGYYKMSYYKGDKEYSGYFPKQYIKIVRGEGKILYKATVEKINLRESPSKDAKIVSSRNKGNLLYLDYEIGDWYAVSYSEGDNWYYGFVLKSEVVKY